MTSTPKPLVLLIALLMVSWVPNVMATDSDGDGVNDSADDFPNDPCADTDTDGDGMPDTISCPGSSGTVAYTSFEDPFTNGSKYFDTGDGLSDYFLWNNVDEPHVAHNQTTGNEMGFTMFYTSTGSVGLTDGDYFGTANYAGTVGNYTDGTQGYQMGDVDGISTLTLDDVTADFVTFDIFVQGGSGNSYEAADNLIIRFVGSSSTVELLNVSGATGSSNNGGFISYMGIWTSFSSNISSLGQGNLEFELNCNSQSESVYFDNVTFTSANSGSGTTTTLIEDDDDDNDGYLDVNDAFPLDASEWADNDGDGIGDNADADDDNDGVDDSADDFPLDPNEDTDTDGDGIGNNADDDDDGDSYSDSLENDCGSDPVDATSIPADTDSDGTCDGLDSDDDGDGIDDSNDAFPLDPNEDTDTDGDGVGNNADTDDDGDGVDDSADAFPLDANEDTDTDGDGQGDNSDNDDDGDGHLDQYEQDCGSDPLDVNDVPVDSDGDGTCDALDVDDDGDGVINSEDAFPLDPYEWNDTDGDGIGGNADLDDDGDGYSDSVENQCGSDQWDWISVPSDTDNDGTCNSLDEDDDGDGVNDVDDMCSNTLPEDYNNIYANGCAPSQTDTDSDGITNDEDTDDDDDDWSDDDEITCGSNPLSETSAPDDYDEDMICDSMDLDADADGVGNEEDFDPLDVCVSTDTDGDGLPDDYTGIDILGQPEDDCSSKTNYIVDDDDDGDGYTDQYELDCGSDSLDTTSIPSDMDNDGTCDTLDSDKDGDGIDNSVDAFPNDSSESLDTDSDGEGDNSDNDDDGDGWPDYIEDNCGSDSMDSTLVPDDLDDDGMCDNQDPDDDGDGFGDDIDVFPDNPNEWLDTDIDGLGDNEDNDDDGDGWLDTSEDSCGSDSMDSTSVPNDIDGDEICDELDSDNTDGPEYVSDDNNTPGFGLVLATLAMLGAAMIVGRRRQ